MTGIASIVLLGVAAQWLAWRLRVPSILLLLLIGFVAGPITGWLDPDELLGNALFPVVSLSVAIIMLEGGLSLRFRDLRGVGGAVRNLILFGVPITWALTTVAARYILGFELGLSFLLGAILVVTGPTVIIPLLRHVRPAGAIGSVVKWEGIVNDPIGAILAVLVVQVILIAEVGKAATGTVIGALTAVFAGCLFGALAAGLLVLLLKHYLVPDFLQNPVALMLAVGAFLASNSVVHESGLLAVTLMGVLLANQRFVVVEHIAEFKENLRVLLISSLFILLAARVPAEEFRSFEPRNLLFVVVLIVVVRPATIFLATLGTSLSIAEKLFLSWMAPRGIVAAAVASVFAIELAHSGYPAPERLVSVVFLVIVSTVALYGLTASFVARKLGLSQANPQGVLILGAHSWARAVAAALKEAGFEVLLADTNRNKVRVAVMEGLDAHHGSVLAEEFQERVDLGGTGRMLALTSISGVNSLAALELAPIFGRSEVYQLCADSDPTD
ncbi:MAG: cation:proton antiporter, partial [Planctomycetota bacterium]|nr:cation:proton antiporter [Planctomycetota bacterium]